MPIWISLLRAVNLGATNKVSMPALRERMSEAGFEDVRTYVQSGNIVARSRHRSERAVAKQLNGLIATHFGLDVPVIVRSPREMAEVHARNPFPEETEKQPTLVSVVFFDRGLGGADGLVAQAEELGERVVASGRELYISYTDRGVHASKLTPAVLRRHLDGQDGTARNWRTVTALIEMTAPRG